MTHDMKSKLSTVLISLGMVVLLAGCVTSSDSRFAREANEDKAVRNYVQLATAYIDQGNLDRARDHLERALEIKPDSASALAAMGLIYQREGDSQLARESFVKAVGNDGSYTRGRVFYGAFLFEQTDFDGAKAQFLKASTDTGYEDRGSVFFNLGRIHQRLGETESAINAFQRSVELTRGEPRALLALSTTLVETGSYTEASRYYSQLMRAMQGNRQMQHSPESLLTGIQIARYFDEWDREASLALVLKNQYPKSDQYQHYKALISNDQ
ncbi:MAG: type IV pilus biogenesis/stability protein PilW [Marinobacter sp.]|uniref:type IV pilus biogenesis/stability protein PilW n=1 Tax=Marinobacter sp. TaxID=50741 RepID=UPI00349FE5B9